MKGDRYWPIYLLLIAAGFFSAAEFLLPKRYVTSRVNKVQEHRYHVRNGSYSWTAVRMENGSFIWTQRTAGAFRPQDSLDLNVTMLLGTVVSYRKHASSPQRWYTVEADDDTNRTSPFIVLLLGVLLLYPRWSMENRMLLQGALGVVAAAWFLTQFATGGHIYKLQMLWGG